MSRFDKLKKINQNIIEKAEDIVYKSNFDFSKYEITDELFISEIRNIEEKLYNSYMSIQHKTKEMCQYLYEAQEKFKTQKEGSFMAWYQNIGLSKDQVSISIMKYKQYMAYGKNPKILESSNRTVKYINQNKDSLKDGEIRKILDNPLKAPEIIKKMRKENLNQGHNLNELEKIEKEINKLEIKLKKLKERKKIILEQK